MKEAFIFRTLLAGAIVSGLLTTSGCDDTLPPPSHINNANFQSDERNWITHRWDPPPGDLNDPDEHAPYYRPLP
jgi:hypothetical protein